MSIQILLVEHDDVGGLYPFSTTHCSWEIRVGAFTILERWQRAVPTASVTASSHRNLHFRSFVERYATTAPFQQLPTLIITGNLIVSPNVMRQMAEACSASEHPIIFFCKGTPIGVFLTQAPESPMAAVVALETTDVDTTHSIEVAGQMIKRLWQTLDVIDDAIRWDAGLVEVHIDEEAVVHPSCVLDTSKGPVLIMEHAQVKPFTLIVGPTVICPYSIVSAHASISSSVIGPVSRVGGEIVNSVFQGYSNKQHEGHLGYSYIGEWCNLGAGTTTSTLKNTYGHISAAMPWLVEDTQRQFLGTLMADHVRTGILTQLGTGSVIGPVVNVVQPGNTSRSLPAFTWFVGILSAEYQLDKALNTARTAMARRMRDLGPETEKLLRHIHAQVHE